MIVKTEPKPSTRRKGVEETTPDKNESASFLSWLVPPPAAAKQLTGSQNDLIESASFVTGLLEPLPVAKQLIDNQMEGESTLDPQEPRSLKSSSVVHQH